MGYTTPVSGFVRAILCLKRTKLELLNGDLEVQKGNVGVCYPDVEVQKGNFVVNQNQVRALKGQFRAYRRRDRGSEGQLCG